MRVPKWVLVAGITTAVTLGAGTSWADSGGNGGGKVVRMDDECDPKTFNAALDPKAEAPSPPCLGGGDVTFGEFAAALNLQVGGHHDWKFEDSSLDMKSGGTLHVVNSGGETHSFTEVVNFGMGIVPPLNSAVPETGPAIPVADLNPNFVDSGLSADVKGLTDGVHRFQCLIHPWMRSTVTVGGN